MSLSADDRARICAAARSYKGVRWMKHGRSHSGVDCIGLVVCAYRDAGFHISETPDYVRLDPKRLMRMVHAYCEPIALDKAQPADVVVYGLEKNESHLAFIVDGNPLNAIHAPAGMPVVESRFDHNRGPIRGCFTWRS